MEANEYQKKALETAVYPNSGEMGGVTYTVLGLTGEAGEVSNKLKKIIRKGFTEINPGQGHDLMDELGDVLWYAAALARELGYSLESVMQYNLDKLAARKAEGTLKDRKYAPVDFTKCSLADCPLEGTAHFHTISDPSSTGGCAK